MKCKVNIVARFEEEERYQYLTTVFLITTITLRPSVWIESHLYVK